MTSFLTQSQQEDDKEPVNLFLIYYTSTLAHKKALKLLLNLFLVTSITSEFGVSP